MENKIDLDSSKLEEWIGEPDQLCQVCLKEGRRKYATDWHHISHATLGSMGGRSQYFMKGDVIVPLCRLHHSELHTLGLKEFERAHGELSKFVIDEQQADERNELHNGGRKHKNRGIR